MADDGEIRTRVRATIQAGKLPNGEPDHVWGGLGSGAACDLCSASIRGDEAEVGLEFGRPTASTPARYVVHVRCFGIWEAERTARPADGSS